jgi:hypothetical protein
MDKIRRMQSLYSSFGENTWCIIFLIDEARSLGNYTALLMVGRQAALNFGSLFGCPPFSDK